MTQYEQPQPMYIERSNGLAIAGLVLSVLGLFVTGILSPIGLIISLVALGKPAGKAAAWAGVAIGFLGMCGWAIVWVIFGATLLATLGLGLFLSQSERVEITRDMVVITAQVEHYKDTHDGVAPASLEILTLDRSTLVDPWGGDYRYVLTTDNELGFDIISDGVDGFAETDDDIHFARFNEYWESAKVDFNFQMKNYRSSGGSTAGEDLDDGDQKDDESYEGEENDDD